MANPSGRKGYAGEAPVLQYLQDRGFYRTYRRRSQGTQDQGDIGGIDGLALEIKNHGVYKLAEWIKEMVKEKATAGARSAALIIKPRNIGASKVEKWWVVLELGDYVTLLKDAGYGPVDEDMQ